jgi:hypothetical protein
MKRVCLTIALSLAIVIPCQGQGTPSVLRCSSSRTPLDLHASRVPGSSVIGRVACGDSILLIDQRFGSAHVRTGDGKDGFILEANFGQWQIEPVAAGAVSPAVPSTRSTGAQAPAARTPDVNPFRRIETFGGYSIIRPDLPGDIVSGETGEAIEAAGQFILGNVLGWGGSVTVNINRFVGITGDFSGHYKNLSGSFEGARGKANLSLHTFLFGPTFKARQGKLEPFVHGLFGFGRPSASISASDRNTDISIDFHETGFAVAAGGGLDVIINDQVALRPIEVDYFPYRTSNGDVFTFNNVRWRSGVVIRFGN